MIMKSFKHSVTVNNKRYEYSIKPIDKETVYVKCPGARMDQRFLVEDIPELLEHLPEMIIDTQNFLKKQNNVIRFRVSADEKRQIQKKAIKAGFSTISAFLRDLALGK